MYSKEKEILVSLFTAIIVFISYSLYMYNNYISADPSLLNDSKFWGQAFVILIPIAIAAQIAVHIIFAIINKIISNEDMPTLSDERDKLIELKSVRISHWIFITGFLLAMGSQAIEMQPYWMFILLFTSGFLASIVEGIAQIYFYRRGV